MSWLVVAATLNVRARAYSRISNMITQLQDVYN